MPRRDHAGAATPTTITGTINASDLSISIATNTGWPTGGVGPFIVVLDPGTAAEEKVNIATQAGGVLTVAGGGRGYDGTTARTHASGATIYPVWSAVEADEANAHVNATADVHGVAGSLAAAISGKQASDATLSALAGLNATPGMVVQTGADVFTKRSLVTGSAKVTITNPAGTAGNPSFDISEADFTAFGRGVVGTAIQGSSADIGTAETITTSVTFTAAAARCYRVAMTTPVLDNQATAANTAIVTLRHAAGATVDATGTIIAKAINNVPPTSTSTTAGTAAETVTLIGYINNAAAGQRTVGLGLAAQSASSNLRFLAGSTIGPDHTPLLMVEDIGPNF